MAEEVAQHVLALKAAKKHFLVISGENMHLAKSLPFARQCQHVYAVRPAIDQVSQKDHGGFGRAALPVVDFNPLDQGDEQIGPSVNIAHGIDTLSRGHAGFNVRQFGLRFFGSKEM